MTEEQFTIKLETLAEEVKQLIILRGKSILKSGGIDIIAWEDNYHLPKLFIMAMSDEIANQFSPHSMGSGDKREINNLKCFI